MVAQIWIPLLELQTLTAGQEQQTFIMTQRASARNRPDTNETETELGVVK